jgi:hypothetical protein
MELLIDPLAAPSTSGERGTGPGTSPAGPARPLAFLRRHGLAVAAVLLLNSLLLLGGNARASEFDEYAVKAAFLYNFAKFVEWPPEKFASADAPLLICIVGENPFGGALATLSGKSVDRRPVEVRNIPTTTSLDPCHIVFLGRAEQDSFKPLLAKLARLPILTVSDIGDFTRSGGMIGLIEAEQRIRFSINLTAARRANLNLSSQLLKLATTVE